MKGTTPRRGAWLTVALWLALTSGCTDSVLHQAQTAAADAAILSDGAAVPSADAAPDDSEQPDLPKDPELTPDAAGPDAAVQDAAGPDAAGPDAAGPDLAEPAAGDAQDADMSAPPDVPSGAAPDAGLDLADLGAPADAEIDTGPVPGPDAATADQAVADDPALLPDVLPADVAGETAPDTMDGADALDTATDVTAADDTVQPNDIALDVSPVAQDAQGDATPAGADAADPPDTATEAGGSPWATDPKKAVANQHQTWQHDPATTMTLSWTTEFADAALYVPHVLYAKASDVGPAGEGLVQKGLTANGAGDSYVAQYVDIAAPKVAWHVELTGLTADTLYVARVGTWTSLNPQTGVLVGGDLGPAVTFRTAPLLGTQQKLTFVLAGDSRGGASKIVQNMAFFEGIEALAWFFNGDMSLNGTQTEWNEWFGAMQPILRHCPLMPVQGNHEVFADHYYAQFALPIAPSLPIAYQEHAWSLDVGSVHFIGLDANYEQGAIDQAPWLAADLKAAHDNPGIEWIVATMHQPAYSACPIHGSTPYVQANWVPLFEKYGVDLVFAGHDHNYERSFPIAANQVAPAGQGVVYVVAGAFFAPPYPNGSAWWTAKSVAGDAGNLVVMTVQGKTLNLTAYSGDGKVVIDTLALQH